MKLRKWLSVLLTFCMLFGLMSVTAYAEGIADDDLIVIVEDEPAAEGPISVAEAPVAEPAAERAGDPELWVCGTQVTEANAADVLGDGKVKFDFAKSTLTFTMSIQVRVFVLEVSLLN